MKKETQQDGNSAAINNIVVFFIVITAIYFGLTFVVNSLEDSQSETYFFDNDAICDIYKSSNKDDVGKSMSLSGLKSDSIKVIFPSGFSSPMKKVTENDGILTIQLIADSGNTDTITIFKNTGVFEREERGNILSENYSESSNGKCR